jgi:hypothetical protein
LAVETIRIDVPEQFGPGWIEVRKKRSFPGRNALAGAGMVLADGVSEADMRRARDDGNLGGMLKVDPHGRIRTTIVTGIHEVAPELLEHLGVASLQELLDSEEVDPDLGDWMLGQVTAICDVEVRSKSGVA